MLTCGLVLLLFVSLMFAMVLSEEDDNEIMDIDWLREGVGGMGDR